MPGGSKSSDVGSNNDDDQEDNNVETSNPEVVTIENESLNSLTLSERSQTKKKLTKLSRNNNPVSSSPITSIQPLEIVDESSSSMIDIIDKPFSINIKPASWIKRLEEDIEKNIERIFKFFKNSRGPYNPQQEEILLLNQFCSNFESNYLTSEDMRTSNIGRLFKYLQLSLTECRWGDESQVDNREK